jgi:hypothetical protein
MLRANALCCAQMIYTARKRSMLRANALYCAQTLYTARKRSILRANALWRIRRESIASSNIRRNTQRHTGRGKTSPRGSKSCGNIEPLSVPGRFSNPSISAQVSRRCGTPARSGRGASGTVQSPAAKRGSVCCRSGSYTRYRRTSHSTFSSEYRDPRLSPPTRRGAKARWVSPGVP